MDFKSYESLRCNISKGCKMASVSSSMTCWEGAEAHKFIQSRCHSSAGRSAQTDGALRSRCNTERHGWASAAASLPDYFLERTVIILGESAELHAVCQHRAASRSHTSSRSRWQTTGGCCCCQLQSSSHRTNARPSSESSDCRWGEEKCLLSKPAEFGQTI